MTMTAPRTTPSPPIPPPAPTAPADIDRFLRGYDRFRHCWRQWSQHLRHQNPPQICVVWGNCPYLMDKSLQKSRSIWSSLYACPSTVWDGSHLKDKDLTRICKQHSLFSSHSMHIITAAEQLSLPRLKPFLKTPPHSHLIFAYNTKNTLAPKAFLKALPPNFFEIPAIKLRPHEYLSFAQDLCSVMAFSCPTPVLHALIRHCAEKPYFLEQSLRTLQLQNLPPPLTPEVVHNSLPMIAEENSFKVTDYLLNDQKHLAHLVICDLLYEHHLFPTALMGMIQHHLLQITALYTEDAQHPTRIPHYQRRKYHRILKRMNPSKLRQCWMLLSQIDLYLKHHTPTWNAEILLANLIDAL